MDTFNSTLSDSYKELMSKLGGWLNELILQVPNFLIAVVVAVLAFVFSKYLSKVAESITRRFTHNKTIVNLSKNLSSIIFGILVLFVILSIFNLGSTINKILATAGVLGLAIGLALQDPMMNFFSGIMMSVRNLYSIGDLVETNGFFGTITNIDLKATKLRLKDGQDLTIPNKSVIQNPLTNYSSSGKRRVIVECGVSYGDDLDKVEETLINRIEKMDNILTNEPVDVIFKEFGGSSINFDVRFWISTKVDFLSIKSKAIKNIKTAFDAENIMIPYPIRTLDFGIKGGEALSDQLKLSAENHSDSEESGFSYESH